MLVKMYLLGILYLTASTVALPFISDSPSEINALNFEPDKRKPENVVVLEKNKEKEDYKYKENDEVKSDFLVFLDSFEENSKVMDSKKRKDDKDKPYDRFREESKEENSKVMDSKKIKNDKDKPDEHFREESKEEKEVYDYEDHSKEKDKKRHKKKKGDKHKDRFIPTDYESAYSYILIDVKYKDDEIILYPDVVFDYDPIGWPESFYEYFLQSSFRPYSMSAYYPPKPFWPFQSQTKYRHPNVVHKKQRSAL